MKTSQVLCALFLSSLLITSRATTGLTITGADTANYPVTLSATNALSVTSSTTNVVPITAITYTTSFMSGLPVTATFNYELDYVSGVAAVTSLIVLKLGAQVAVTVTAGYSASGTSAPTANAAGATMLTSAPVATSTTCGQYYLDCAAGALTFVLYSAAPTSGNNGYCIVTVAQYAAITGILSYPTASAPASPYTALQTSISASNSATSPTTTVCGSSTANSMTYLYFISTYGTTTASADQTTAYNKVKATAAAGGFSSNTGYYVSQDTGAVIGGGTNAPSASAATNTVTVSKSQTRMVVFAGVLSTAFATIFGLTL